MSNQFDVQQILPRYCIICYLAFTPQKHKIQFGFKMFGDCVDISLYFCKYQVQYSTCLQVLVLVLYMYGHRPCVTSSSCTSRLPLPTGRSSKLLCCIPSALALHCAAYFIIFHYIHIHIRIFEFRVYFPITRDISL